MDTSPLSAGSAAGHTAHLPTMTATTRTSSTHRAHMGEGYYVTVQHCEGPGLDGSGCDAYLGTNYPSDLCPACKALIGAVTASCGCPLEAACAMHRDDDGHRHCGTCGVPVSIYDFAEADGSPEYDDHECPPGFLPRPGEATPTNACRKTPTPTPIDQTTLEG